MPPVWKPNEVSENLYDEVEHHSDGMISFAYRAPTPADLEALKQSATYRIIQAERARSESEDLRPSTGRV